ncbi:MAG: hypothetical protein AUG46_07715 [Acidobacteria bacterium 13_1_20CM_3_58_11]|nr:MAG: hypothetical protein AUG46_07715 [Acidobacteria bacterium 13_1_20CM_3_58_11]
MRSERVRKLLFESEHCRGFIEILFAAVIALDPEGAIERRARGEGIGFGKGDSMPEEKVLPKMKPMVLAEHHPAVVAINPHSLPLRFLPVGATGNRRRCGNLDVCPAASICARKRPTCVGGNNLFFFRSFLILEGACAWQGVRGRAAADRLTSARSSGLGVIEFLRNWGRAGRLEGKEEAHRNNGNAHSRE